MTEQQPRHVPHSDGTLAAPEGLRQVRRGVVREFLVGVGVLGRGLRWWGTSPRLLLIGVVPALIAFLLLAAAYGALVYWIGDLVGLATPFAAGWAAGWRILTRVVVGVAMLGVAALLAVFTYTALTLAIGDPFYEKISWRVERRLGDAPDDPATVWWRSLGRSIRDSLVLLVVSLCFGIALFVAGFVPLLGETVVPVVGVFVGGWLLTLELLGMPFEHRGLRLRDRRRAVGRRRPLALGFGVATFVLFLIPFGAVVVMPAAVAGAPELTRRLLGERDPVS